MPMDSVSDENVEKITKEHCNKADELSKIKSTDIQNIWLNELELLENEYILYQKERQVSTMGEIFRKKNKNNISNEKKTFKKQKHTLEIIS